MKQYKGLRPLEDIYALMKDKKMSIDSKDFEKGGDYVNFKGEWDNKPLTIAVNTFNGEFFVSNGFTGELIGTHLSDDKDNEKWYEDILNVLYMPLEIVGISFAEIYKTLGHELKYGGYIEYSKDATDYYDFKFDNILIGCDGESFEIIEDSKIDDMVILKAVEDEGTAIIRLSQQEFGVGCFSSTYHNF